jgi:hypothetical protein
MTNLTIWTAIIAAGAAILSSMLTSYLTHLLYQRQRKKEYELKWLEERFGPALDFLGKVLAAVSNTPKKPGARKRIANEIYNIVTSQSKDSNAWYVSVLLDPENTGLRDYVQSAMTYARIQESNKEFINYEVRLQMSLEELAEEFRRERQAIVKGKSLDNLIAERKTRLDKSYRQFSQALGALKAFVKGESDIEAVLAKVGSSSIRGARLKSVLSILATETDKQTLTRLEEVTNKCIERRWLSKAEEY